ncbi:MAG: ASKHA domain-containing protein [Nibricoccus sp.]
MIVIRDANGAIERKIAVTRGSSRLLSDVLAENGYPLNTRCGKRGWCRGCTVELAEGRPGVGERKAEIKSCGTTVQSDTELVIRVPAHARLEAEPQVGDTFAVNTPVALQPLWNAEPGVADTAFAVDIGTTTVAVAVLDLVSGSVLSRAGDFNAQIRYGDNVITRIVAAGSASKRREMQRAIVNETIAPLLAQACGEAGRSLERVVGGTVAGNTTMLHILCGEDPTSLGSVPFTPRFLEHRTLTAKQLGLEVQLDRSRLGEATPVVVLPGFSAYVGADLAAGVYANGMMCDATPSLLVDIGTNGEIVLQANGKLWGCATAAGPAFEGAGLLAGTRAQSGAISHVMIFADREARLEFETIAGTAPENAPGLCGTAYIDFLAAGRNAGILTSAGRFEKARTENLFASRFVQNERGRCLNLVGRICISEADIAALLQAKAAIGAGIETLLKSAGLVPSDVGTLYLAGGFGMFIDVAHAIAIGLLPGFSREQVKVVGNTSLAGAVLSALDQRALSDMEGWRNIVQIVELNTCEGFENCYLDHLALP